MNLLTQNLRIGRAERRWENGREYFVAPITSIVPGVLPGSDGPGLYLPADISASASSWDGIPLTAYHPVSNDGRPCSARESGVAERQHIGEVRDSAYKGKLVHKGWFDAEMTRRKEPRIYHNLSHGIPIETSTGLHLQKVPAPQGSLHNGRPYNWTAKAFVPDHLAVLPDQVGACGLNDGCGVLVNVLVTNRHTGKPSISSLVESSGMQVLRENHEHIMRQFGLTPNGNRIKGWKPNLAFLTNMTPDIDRADHLAEVARQRSRMAVKIEDHEEAMEAFEQAAEAYHKLVKKSTDYSARDGQNNLADWFDKKAAEHRAKAGKKATTNMNLYPTLNELVSVVNAEQPRHPRMGRFLGKPQQAAKKGFADLQSILEPPGRIGEPAPQEGPDGSGMPIEDEDDKVGQGDRPQKSRRTGEVRLMTNVHRCPECGGEMEGKECECGYRERDEDTYNRLMAPVWNWCNQHGGTSCKAGASGTAQAASMKAKSEKTPFAHLAAHKAHMAAAGHHYDNNNQKQAQRHLDMAKSHKMAAGKGSKSIASKWEKMKASAEEGPKGKGTSKKKAPAKTAPAAPKQNFPPKKKGGGDKAPLRGGLSMNELLVNCGMGCGGPARNAEPPMMQEQRQRQEPEEEENEEQQDVQPMQPKQPMQPNNRPNPQKPPVQETRNMRINRDQTISFLVANCDCSSTGVDAARATLNQKTDADLVLLKGRLLSHIVANAKAEGSYADTNNPGAKPIQAGGMAHGADDEVDYEEDEDDDLDDDEVHAEDAFTGKKGTQNRQSLNTSVNQQQMSYRDFMAVAPPRVRNVIQNALKVENRQRQEIADQLVLIANASLDPNRRHLILNKLKSKPAPSLGQLNELLALVGPGTFNHTSSGSVDESGEPTPLFLGGQGTAEFVGNQADNNDNLSEVVVNWTVPPNHKDAVMIK